MLFSFLGVCQSYHARTVGEELFAERIIFFLLLVRGSLTGPELLRNFKYLPKTSDSQRSCGWPLQMYCRHCVFVPWDCIVWCGNYILPIVGILLVSSWENPGGTEVILLFLVVLSMSQGSGFIPLVSYNTLCLCLLSLQRE